MMGNEPDTKGTPAAKDESREAYQRRLARAVGILMIAGGIAFSVIYFTGPGPKYIPGYLVLAGCMFGFGWGLLVFWRTGHDPKGYSKPMFGKGDEPIEPKGEGRGATKP